MPTPRNFDLYPNCVTLFSKKARLCHFWPANLTALNRPLCAAFLLNLNDRKKKRKPRVRFKTERLHNKAFCLLLLAPRRTIWAFDFNINRPLTFQAFRFPVFFHLAVLANPK